MLSPVFSRFWTETVGFDDSDDFESCSIVFRLTELLGGLPLRAAEEASQCARLWAVQPMVRDDSTRSADCQSCWSQFGTLGMLLAGCMPVSRYPAQLGTSQRISEEHLSVEVATSFLAASRWRTLISQ
jgi:hypothetical protein